MIELDTVVAFGTDGKVVGRGVVAGNEAINFVKSLADVEEAYLMTNGKTRFKITRVEGEWQLIPIERFLTVEVVNEAGQVWKKSLS